jgi:hypothetical protein
MKIMRLLTVISSSPLLMITVMTVTIMIIIIIIIIIIILKSELNARNKITATGALPIPVLRYSSGIINWRIEDIKKLTEKSRKILTMYKVHHPKADIDRLYVKRKEEERGLVQVEAAYKAVITSIAEYLNTNYKVDQLVNIFKSYESTQPTVNSIIKTAAKIAVELSQPNEKSDAKQEGIQHTKAILGEVLKNKCKNKVIHGQYIRNIDSLLVKKTRSSGFRRET